MEKPTNKESLQFAPATVKMVRSNSEGNGSRTLVYENYQSSEYTKNLSLKYNIPEEFILEILSMGQVLGYIPGCKIEADCDALSTHNGGINEIINKVKSLQVSEYSDQTNIEEGIAYYLSSLSQIPFIQEYKKKGISREVMKEGLLRRRSLNDKDMSTIPTFKDFCEYCILNLQMIDKFFGNQTLDLMIETSGLPVDDIDDKNSTRFSQEKGVIGLGSITYPNSIGTLQTVDAHIRFIPAFSPLGITMTLGFDAKDAQGEIQRDNYFYIVGLTFEKHGDKIIPLLHTMQNTGHNLGFDKDGNLFFVREPMSESDKNAGFISLVPDASYTTEQEKQRQKLSYYLDDALKVKFQVPKDKDLMQFLYGFMAEKMSFLGFENIESIAPHEQRRLLGHNIGRDFNKVLEHAKEKYTLLPSTYSHESYSPSCEGRTGINYAIVSIKMQELRKKFERQMIEMLEKYEKRKDEFEKGMKDFEDRFCKLPSIMEEQKKAINLLSENENIKTYLQFLGKLNVGNENYEVMNKKNKGLEEIRSVMQNIITRYYGPEVWDNVDPVYKLNTSNSVLQGLDGFEEKLTHIIDISKVIEQKFQDDVFLGDEDIQNNIEEVKVVSEYSDVDKYFELLRLYKAHSIIIKKLSSDKENNDLLQEKTDIENKIKEIGIIPLEDSNNILLFFPFIKKLFVEHNKIHQHISDPKTKYASILSFFQKDNQGKYVNHEKIFNQLDSIVRGCTILMKYRTQYDDMFVPLLVQEKTRSDVFSLRVIQKIFDLYHDANFSEEQRLNQRKQLFDECSQKYGVDISGRYDYDIIGHTLQNTGYIAKVAELRNLEKEYSELATKFAGGKDLKKDKVRIDATQDMLCDLEKLHQALMSQFPGMSNEFDQIMLSNIMQNPAFKKMLDKTQNPLYDETFELAFLQHVLNNGYIR